MDGGCVVFYHQTGYLWEAKKNVMIWPVLLSTCDAWKDFTPKKRPNLNTCSPRVSITLIWCATTPTSADHTAHISCTEFGRPHGHIQGHMPCNGQTVRTSNYPAVGPLGSVCTSPSNHNTSFIVVLSKLTYRLHPFPVEPRQGREGTWHCCLKHRNRKLHEQSGPNVCSSC